MTEPSTTARTSAIRTRAVSRCVGCGEEGELLYGGLEDRLFGAPGRWSLRRCASTECGLLWLDPMPRREDIGRAYRNYYTHVAPPEPPLTPARRWYRKVVAGYLARCYGYGHANLGAARLFGSVLSAHPGRREEAEFSVLYLPARPGGALLDVGCGGGGFLRRMEELGWDGEGVDVDPEAVARARSLGLRVREGTLETVSYPDSHFDAVTLSHLIEHVFDPAAVLRECHRILKRGGCLVVVTPNAESWGHRLYGRHWRGLEPPRHLFLFTLRVLRRMVAEAGFQTIDARTTIRDANGMLLASRALRRQGAFRMGVPQSRPLRLWGRFLQFVEWARLPWDPLAGEEIALVARK